MTVTVMLRRCRVCDQPLDTILDLGMLALSDFRLPGDPPTATAPLEFCQCRGCGLVQLRHTVDPEVMFRQYWYRSGINEAMRAELADVVEQAIAWVGGLVPTDTVIDIGANDGTLLSCLNGLSYRIAFEPASNLHDDLRPHANRIVPDFFPAKEVEFNEARLIFSIACFYDLDNPKAFVEEVARLLTPTGAWIVQFQDLHQMIEATAFDNICFEHLVYYSLASFERLIAPYGLRVTHVEPRAINGGSYRLIVQHDVMRADATVAHQRHVELGCEHWHTLERFTWRVNEARRQIQGMLVAYLHPVIDVYGASTKFNTLSQYCGLDHPLIRQAWERSDAKWGRLTATGIPIVSEADGRADPPDLLLVGIWQFREAILKREAAYLAGGGIMLFPLPVVDLVSGAKGDR